MRRVLFSLLLAVAVSAGVSAQSWKGLLGKVASEVVAGASSGSETGNAVVNVLGSLLGNSLALTADAVVGTWNYEGVACVLESEKALSDIGGSVVATQLESKLDGMMTKVGVKPGDCSFLFSKDGACEIHLGDYVIDGTYELLPEEKVLNLTFLYGGFDLKTYVAYEIQNLNIVFKADKLLNFVKNTASALAKNATGEELKQLSSVSQIAATLSVLLSVYDGLMLGAKLSRSADSVVESVPSTSNVKSAASGLSKLLK